MIRPVRAGLLAVLSLRLAAGVGAQGDGLSYLLDGITAYEQGRWDASAEALQKAVAAGFAEPLYRIDALVYLGRVHARLGQEALAASYFQQVLDIQPHFRLDRSDPNGLAVFDALFASPPAQPAPPAPDASDRQGARWWLWSGLVAVAGAVTAVVFSSGGSDSPPETGSVEGELELP